MILRLRAASVRKPTGQTTSVDQGGSANGKSVKSLLRLLLGSRGFGVQLSSKIPAEGGVRTTSESTTAYVCRRTGYRRIPTFSHYEGW